MKQKIIRMIAGALCILMLLSGCQIPSVDPTDPQNPTNPTSPTNPPVDPSDLQAGIINTVYGTEDVLVADYIINAACGADPTGETDSTAAIQSVLDLCADNGGGTVYLPAGRYLISSQIRIPSFVYLHGDCYEEVGVVF